MTAAALISNCPLRFDATIRENSCHWSQSYSLASVAGIILSTVHPTEAGGDGIATSPTGPTSPRALPYRKNRITSVSSVNGRSRNHKRRGWDGPLVFHEAFGNVTRDSQRGEYGCQVLLRAPGVGPPASGLPGQRPERLKHEACLNYTAWLGAIQAASTEGVARGKAACLN
jgi:hypothetical protein